MRSRKAWATRDNRAGYTIGVRREGVDGRDDGRSPLTGVKEGIEGREFERKSVNKDRAWDVVADIDLERSCNVRSLRIPFCLGRVRVDSVERLFGECPEEDIRSTNVDEAGE